MNRWTGTGHLTRDPELVTTSGGTQICLMRIAVKRAARDGAAGYFDVKAFGDQGVACAEYLKSGREVAIEGRLRFEEFETSGGDYASRVYIVADAFEFLPSRRRGDSQAENARSRTPTSTWRPSRPGAGQKQRASHEGIANASAIHQRQCVRRSLAWAGHSLDRARGRFGARDI